MFWKVNSCQVCIAPRTWGLEFSGIFQSTRLGRLLHGQSFDNRQSCRPVFRVDQTRLACFPRMSTNDQPRHASLVGGTWHGVHYRVLCVFDMQTQICCAARCTSLLCFPLTDTPDSSLHSRDSTGSQVSVQQKHAAGLCWMLVCYHAAVAKRAAE